MKPSIQPHVDFYRAFVKGLEGIEQIDCASYDVVADGKILYLYNKKGSAFLTVGMENVVYVKGFSYND